MPEKIAATNFLHEFLAVTVVSFFKNHTRVRAFELAHMRAREHACARAGSACANRGSVFFLDLEKKAFPYLTKHYFYFP